MNDAEHMTFCVVQFVMCWLFSTSPGAYLYARLPPMCSVSCVQVSLFVVVTSVREVAATGVATGVAKGAFETDFCCHCQHKFMCAFGQNFIKVHLLCFLTERVLAKPSKCITSLI